MKKIKIGENEVEFFNSAEEMPIKRYNRFNKFIMIDNEVGSDFSDFDRRSAKTMQFLKNKMYPEALKEISNRRQMVFNAFMEYSPKDRALAILVKSINGEPVVDYGPDALDKVLETLSEMGLSKAQSSDIVDESKKKIEKELKMYFPSQFRDSESDEYYYEWKKKMIQEVEELLRLEEPGENKHEKRMLELNGCNIWNVNDPNSMEIQMETGFQKVLLSLSEYYSGDIEEMSTFTYHSLNEMIAERNKALKNGRRDNKV